MANVSTVSVTWSGFTGAPGYSRHRFFELASGTQVQTAVNAVRTYYDALKAYWLNTWTITVSPVVQQNDIVTGDLVSEIAAGTPPTTIAGTAGTGLAYAGGSGFVTNWLTGAFRNGRKVRGRTFIVPAIGVYFSDGTITSAVQTASQAAGNALIATNGVVLGVWAKDFDGGKPPQQVGGALYAASSCFTPDRAAQLRTRRS